jgi:hypothetical protein
VIVILAHPDDDGALWLDEALRRLGMADVEFVTVEQLVFSRRIVHRMADTGDTGAIHLADGRVLRPEAISGLVNRVRHLPVQHFAGAAPGDREYAAAELSAFMLAWLNGVAGRVINPPRPLALDGSACEPTTLVHLAAMAGLPTMPWHQSTCEGESDEQPRLAASHSIVVLDDRVFGAVIPRGLQDAARRLAVLLGVPLLQVFLHQSNEDGWRFVHATGRVDFRMAGRPLAAGVAHAFAAGVPA